ncbi:MAG: DUF488 domain-containing protein [Acidobacteriales bacterium]|nr:DUF488 domain-containing protein [Terriglobales bacterium]
MIRVKRIYEPPDKDDGLRILVDRIWPRGMPKERAAVDLWLKDVAPSDDLRKWFGHKPDRWPEFKSRYHRELEKYKQPLKEIATNGREAPITLLYAAKDEDHNNAVALQEYLQR